MSSVNRPLRRRSLIGAGLTALGALPVLSACGFRLRGTTAIPVALQQPYIEGLAVNDPLALELSILLQGNGATPVAAADVASAVITILDQKWREDVRAIGQTGGAVDFELTYRVVFSSRGITVPYELPRTDVITTGSFSYPETDALQRAEGKRIVEQDLMREAALAIVERIRAVVPA